MNAARALRAARRRAGMSQTELARRAGVPPQTINRIERAERVPKVDTLIRLLAAAGATLTVSPRLGATIERGPIRDLLQTPPRARLPQAHMEALDELVRRRVRFIVVGDAAARLHGAPIEVSALEIALGPDHMNPLRLERAERTPVVRDVVTIGRANYGALRSDAEELPWLPAPTMRVLNDWIDAPKGFLASIDDLLRDATPERRDLLAALQEEIDEEMPGHRIYRQKDL